jgi:hypothetical protein
MALSHQLNINILYLSAFHKTIATKVTDFHKNQKDKFTGLGDDFDKVEGIG